MADDIETKESSIERREYFRVNDVLPLITRKIENMAGKKSRALSGYFAGLGVTNCVEDVGDGTVSPKLWKMLCDINSKLDLILDRLFGNIQETEGVETKEISLSASGMSFRTQNQFDVGDLVEVKMFLPLHPPVWIIVYGNIVRFDKIDNEEHEVGIRFLEMEDEIRDILSFYTIKRQRELIMKRRGYDTE
jgi:hypothetical protein